MSQATTISYFVVTTGTASGTWEIDCSNDRATWVAYTLDTTPPAASGSPQTFEVSVVDFECGYARLTFVGSGGSGSATATSQAKG